MLGKGAQSKVFVVEDTSKPDRPRFAMKVLKKRGKIMSRIKRKVDVDSRLWHEDKNDPQKHKRKVWVEVAVGRLLRHKNIVPMYEVITSKDRVYMIMELQERVLKKKRSRKWLDLEEARSWFVQLADGVSHMHEQGVVHRDLKVENLLVNHDGTVKIADFGMSHIIRPGENDTLKLGVGSMKYRSPEQFPQGARDYSGKLADVWTMGVILYCLVDGKLPFAPFSDNKKEQRYQIANGILRYPPRIRQDPQLVDLLGKILRKDPAERISVEEIKAHPWLQEGGSTEEERGNKLNKLQPM
jgi:[calcium/calmodulin-dependent protein kinase] kinase